MMALAEAEPGASSPLPLPAPRTSAMSVTWPSGPAYGIKAFTARAWDPEIGLYYYRARYYDPKVGRFLSEDPAGTSEGPNLYRYVLNSPVRFVDPTGRYVFIVCRAVDDTAAKAFGGAHCYLEVACPKGGMPPTIISYLFPVKIVSNYRMSREGNADTQNAMTSDNDTYPVKSDGCCRLEKCLLNKARQMQAGGFAMPKFSLAAPGPTYNPLAGPNSNTFPAYLLLKCGSPRMPPGPGPHGWPYGWMETHQINPNWRR
jgi:RHS repeat-associated protein